MDNVTIRNGKWSDLDAVVDAMRTWWGGRDFSALVSRSDFVHFNDTILVAENERELLGFVIGYLSQSIPHEAYLKFIGVRPEQRKHGLGRNLCDRFFARCKDRGAITVTSCTSISNKASIAFHLSLGFSVRQGNDTVDSVSVFKDYLGKNSPAVLFERKLA